MKRTVYLIVLLILCMQGIPVGRADKLDELKPGVYLFRGKKISIDH